MGTRAPRVGDKITLFNIDREARVVGLGVSTITVQDGHDQITHLDRRNEGQTWQLINSAKSFVAKTGAKTMQKKAFTILVLQHEPVAGIPETTADIKTTMVIEPEIVLATSQESAEAIALRKVPTTVNVEYIEVLVREF